MAKSTNMDEVKKYNTLSRNLLTASSILLMFITVFNVFIVAFAGVAGVSVPTSSSTGAPN